MGDSLLPRPPLDGMRVAISVSESSLQSDPGFSPEEVNRLTVRLAELLLGAGACVVFGHNWRRGGVIDAIYCAALRNRQAGVVSASDQPSHEGARIINLLPWPDKPGLSDEEQAEAKGTVEIRPTGLPDECSDYENAAPSSPEFVWLRARSLTQMRRCLVETSHAMICVGGRTTASQGRYPGVVEEVFLMTQARKPVYLSGLLGGAARDMIHAIERAGDTSECLTRIQTTRSDVLDGFAKFGNPESSDNKVDHEALRRHFAETLTLERLQEANGLAADDHKQLLHAIGHQQVLTLVLRGLTALWSKRQCE